MMGAWTGIGGRAGWASMAMVLITGMGWAAEETTPMTSAEPIQPVAAVAKAMPQVGVSFAPAICLATNVPVGQTIDLAAAGQPFLIDNRGHEASELYLTAIDPLRGGMPLWEYGYEPIPDPSWIRCSLDSNVPGSPARTTVAVSITVPDDPRWAGRKFVAGVRLSSGKPKGLGAGLAMCARLLVETTDRFQHDSGGGWLATVPGTVRVENQAPGTSGVRVLTLRNGTEAPLAIQIRRLAEAEPRAAKRRDYLTVQPVPAAWMPAPGPIDLAVGADLTVRLPFTIPAEATPGSYEDLLLFATAEDWAIIDAVATDPAQRRVQPRTAAVRVRFEVVAPSAPALPQP